MSPAEPQKPNEIDALEQQLQRVRTRKIRVAAAALVLAVAFATAFVCFDRAKPCERLARAVCASGGVDCPDALVQAFVKRGTDAQCASALEALGKAGDAVKTLVATEILRDVLGPEVGAKIDALRAAHGLPSGP